jgi:hypothetical protein
VSSSGCQGSEVRTGQFDSARRKLAFADKT